MWRRQLASCSLHVSIPAAASTSAVYPTMTIINSLLLSPHSPLLPPSACVTVRSSIGTRDHISRSLVDALASVHVQLAHTMAGTCTWANQARRQRNARNCQSPIAIPLLASLVPLSLSLSFSEERSFSHTHFALLCTCSHAKTSFFLPPFSVSITCALLCEAL